MTAKEKDSEIKLRDVVVSSASAPYYFPPKEFEADGKRYKLIDGCLVANNPEYEMKPENAKMDNTNEKNLDNLKRIGEGLIAKYVAFPNSETGLPNVISEDVEKSLSYTCLPQKNQAELERFAKKLYNERRRRMLYNKISLLINPYLS
ncbi:unnamed protein product [Camellia sinensis]